MSWVWIPGRSIEVDFTADEERQLEQGYIVQKGRGRYCNPLLWGFREMCEGRPWPWPTSETADEMTFYIANSTTDRDVET